MILEGPASAGLLSPLSPRAHVTLSHRPALWTWPFWLLPGGASPCPKHSRRVSTTGRGPRRDVGRTGPHTPLRPRGGSALAAQVRSGGWGARLFPPDGPLGEKPARRAGLAEVFPRGEFRRGGGILESVSNLGAVRDLNSSRSHLDSALGFWGLIPKPLGCPAG